MIDETAKYFESGKNYTISLCKQFKVRFEYLHMADNKMAVTEFLKITSRSDWYKFALNERSDGIRTIQASGKSNMLKLQLNLQQSKWIHVLLEQKKDSFSYKVCINMNYAGEQLLERCYTHKHGQYNARVDFKIHPDIYGKFANLKIEGE